MNCFEENLKLHKNNVISSASDRKVATNVAKAIRKSSKENRVARI